MSGASTTLLGMHSNFMGLYSNLQTTQGANGVKCKVYDNISIRRKWAQFFHFPHLKKRWKGSSGICHVTLGSYISWHNYWLVSSFHSRHKSMPKRHTAITLWFDLLVDIICCILLLNIFASRVVLNIKECSQPPASPQPPTVLDQRTHGELRGRSWSFVFGVTWHLIGSLKIQRLQL